MSLPVKAMEFLKAGAAVRKNMVRCGFELETQWSDGGNPELDEDAYFDALYSRVDNAIGSDMSDALSGSRHRNLLASLREALHDYYMQDDDMRAEFESSGRPEAPCDAVEVGTDGSVSGWEFRTKGALTYRGFNDAANAVFDLEHTIDAACSFHIHLSIPGVEHKYGVNMQRAMVEYMAMNAHRLPESVRKRLSRAASNTYINQLVGKSEKYCFVRFHPQGTWEFRCIGNVQNEADARICLDLCIEALAHGYAVVADIERLYWRSAVSEDAWRYAVFSAFSEGTEPFACSVVNRPVVAA